jgi:ribosome-binding protein aMBF1 (putative translation factor)
MKCQRCGNDKEAEFRVVSDILDMKVCADCAGEARKIGLSLTTVKIDDATNDRGASKDGRQRRDGKIDSTGSKHRHQTQRRVA